MRIENPHRAFDDEPVKIMRPDDVAKRFAKAVEEIENEAFLDLDFLFRALEPTNPPALSLIGKEPAEKRGDKQPKREEDAWSRSRVTSLGSLAGGRA